MGDASELSAQPNIYGEPEIFNKFVQDFQGTESNLGVRPFGIGPDAYQTLVIGLQDGYARLQICCRVDYYRFNLVCVDSQLYFHRSTLSGGKCWRRTTRDEIDSLVPERIIDSGDAVDEDSFFILG